ncbi:MAG: hypothetical protein JHC34_01570 [Acidobacteria bacterium]|nr:hypothetical protein [Acidobacteriota bacterium]
MKMRIGILLCGCGALDGTDPHEAILSMAEIQRLGHDAICIAADRPQLHVVNHATFLEIPDKTRSQYDESSRLSYGKLFNIIDISPKMIDALLIPGGQGAVKNLMAGFGVLSEQRQVYPDVAKFIEEVSAASGKIGAIGLAEFVVTELFGPWPSGKNCMEIGPDEIITNEGRGVAATPGALQCTNLAQMQAGISKLIEHLTHPKVSSHQ